MQVQPTQFFRPIKVVDIELSTPIATIENLEGYETLKGLVRLHGVPLGYIELGVSHGRCTAAEISTAIVSQHSWAIMRHLIDDGLANKPFSGKVQLADLIDTPHPSYTGQLPSMTVVVCTRDRAADLARCLEALTQLRYPRLDILVVDNAPATDATEQLVRFSPHVRYVCELCPGLSWARNRAIQEAHGDIIAFTDDDVVVDPGWALALAAVFAEHPHLMAVTGLVVPYELETEAQILFEAHGGFGRGFERKWYGFNHDDQQAESYHGAGKFGTGANMAFRRSLFDAIGPFDTALGAGTPANGGEDLEIFFRLLHEGHTLVYEPSALVYHRHRHDYASLRRQLYGNGVGLSAYHMRSALVYPEERAAFCKLHMWWLWTWHIKRLIQSLTRPHRFPRDLIRAELHGYLVGLSRYPHARRVKAQMNKKFGDFAPKSSLDNLESGARQGAEMPLMPLQSRSTD